MDIEPQELSYFDREMILQAKEKGKIQIEEYIKVNKLSDKDKHLIKEEYYPNLRKYITRYGNDIICEIHV